MTYLQSFRPIIAVIAMTLGAATVSLAQDEPIVFNRDIRPILSEYCFACHGPDSASRKADLRLDQADVAAMKKAIIAGKPDESGVIERILSDDPDAVMPPPATKKTLTANQKNLLKRWIASGAEYQPHWSFIAPVRPPVPKLKNAAWVRNPIDAFVLAKLESMGLTPAPEADRRTLARRLSLDLTGLPPTPELVDTFVADQSPNAYESFVDKLMESPHWGEHRGRYWLDSARFADTHGIHFDNFREMWTYRDSVIAAFNRNIPFDQFTINQLAGDLLPDRTMDQQIESGFNRCNITTSEGGAIAEEYLVLYARDRTETVGQVWLGMTVGCAVCHDHKFDPFSAKDFYSLAAFFNNTTQNAMDGNIKDTPPIITVPLAADKPRFDSIGGEIAAAKQSVETRRQDARPVFNEWLANATSETLAATLPVEALSFHAAMNEGSGKSMRAIVNGEPHDVTLNDSAQWIDGVSSKALQLQGSACDFPEVGDFEKDQAFSCSAWVKVQPNDSAGAIVARMDKPEGYQGWDMWVQQRRVGMHMVSRWPNDALKVVSQAQLKPNEWTHVGITYDGSSKAVGVKIYFNGILQQTNVEADKLSNSIRTTVPFRIGERSAGQPASGAGVQDLRLYKRNLTAAEIEGLAKVTRFGGILAKAAEQRTDAEKNEVYPWWLGAYDAAFQERTTKVAALEAEQNAIKSRGTIAHVMQEKSEEAMAYILFRGEYDKRRDPVKPATPTAVLPFPEAYPRNRLGLAKWLLEPNHPLTTRVTVNRFWQELFGTGLVRTSGDFGIAGELPSDQELLDWMAVEFRESGWDMKKFYKLIVTSATYRQSAVVTKDKLEKDPANRFMSRGPRFRMDAEVIRDYALAASGLLVPKLGGPSVKPYQPEGVWEAVAMIGSNTRDYRRDAGENLYRRSMYTFIKRAAPPASMEIFNAPARELCTVRRERTDTPLQALVTLNDVQFVEAARHLAQSILKDATATDDVTRLNTLAKRLLARPFRTDEMPIVQNSLKDLREFYQSHPEDAKKLVAEGESKADPTVDPALLAAWTMLTNEILNLDEVLNK
ncbi:MAG: Planctomycete cytochrome [Schlesneria sp.]|nr:Planctomycete cytochrome [Schlesneria sp.]